ncbi:hypothetical protein A3Q56_08268 [Intoshia linei]|uniref:Uncharacterized protein n=1 Tax=Intoshia linei TaxID=1819745 RepID=A0A177ARL1_9BILA|nr:hypothetical protein A3Q56_08268 [Intoshia linei]
MLQKCSLANCRTNNDEGCEKVKTYGFPCNEEEKVQWISDMPNVFSDGVTNNMPVNPPSIFYVPSSCLRQTDSKIDRKFSSRNISIENCNSKDELYEFQAMDAFPLDWLVFSTNLIKKYQTDYVVKKIFLRIIHFQLAKKKTLTILPCTITASTQDF